ncbi:TetR/AcrR family transcriptional regulator [Paenibacillus dokdonensis]|uniref:TetR/AcrR family transcriptional regulator n=1 Tax=Paenibacillus dokdonensis TaxID=2567944 RepID=UPI0010A8B2ED|nr:TetR/AcrR family transcriptional regulator [Paenibacillus dokdonensis]
MSPRTKEQNEQIRKQRKQEILNAAIRVYVDKGYAASEMADIANQAGLAHGLAFYYFKNKKNLFRELYEYMMEESKQYTKAFFEQEIPVLELFSSYARIVCERVIIRPEISRFYMRIGLDLHLLYSPDEISPFKWVKSFMEQMTKTIEKGIAQDMIRQGDAHLMAMQFWGSVSQGMAYLDQTKQELESQGIPEADVTDQLNKVLNQIIESSVAVIKP